MTAQTDPIVAGNDWKAVPLAKKWWLQVVLTLLIVPVGLLLMIFLPSYQVRKGSVVRVGKASKFLIVILVSLTSILGLARLASLDTSDQLQVQLNQERSLLLRNIGEDPIEIQEIEVNRRPECKAGRMTLKDADAFKPLTLQVGEKAIWIANCNIVRINIKTNKGPYEYSFVR